MSTHYFYTESRGDGAYRAADATAITKPRSLELFKHGFNVAPAYPGCLGKEAVKRV